MNRYILIPFLLLTVLPLSMAQQDPMAGRILDRFSAKALAAPAITMLVEITIEDAVEQTGQKLEGKVAIKKDKYKLEIPENIIWYNGETLWTLSPELEEVTITLPDREEGGFISDPSTLFIMYREGYKYRLVEETSRGSVIDLYPEDLSAEFSRIRLLIDSDANLVETEYKRKDGITMFISIKSYTLKTDYPDQFFNFDSSKYKNIEVIDMR